MEEAEPRPRECRRRARRQKLTAAEKRARDHRNYVRYVAKNRARTRKRYRRLKSDPVQYVEHLAKMRRHKTKYRHKHRERVRTVDAALKRRLRKERPEYCNGIKKRQRARRAGALGSHTDAQWMARVAFYGWRCFYCRAILTAKTLTRDHRIPLTKGGTDFASNLVPACHSCNSRKGARSSYMEKRPLLNLPE